jgi:5'-3' exonuclease
MYLARNMGVKGLYTYVKPYRRSIIPDMCEPARIGVDAMSLIYKYKSEYKQLYPYIQLMKDKGHKMIFVFDGKAPVEKTTEINDRRETRLQAAAQASNLKQHLEDPTLTKREREILEFSVARLEYKGWHMSREIRIEVQEELTRMGIPFVKALQEADDVLIDLNARGCIDVVISTDMDFLLAGVRRLWIPARDSYEEILLQDVMDGESVTEAGIRDAGILCGVEPLHGKVCIVPKTAFGWIRHYGSIEGVLKALQDPVLNVLRDPTELARVRSHFDPDGLRIREEWQEGLKEFCSL